MLCGNDNIMCIHESLIMNRISGGVSCGVIDLWTLDRTNHLDLQPLAIAIAVAFHFTAGRAIAIACTARLVPSTQLPTSFEMFFFCIRIFWGLEP